MLGAIKRGDTFAFSVAITDKATGGALVGAADKLRCCGKYHGRDDVLVEMVISETATPGTYLFSAGPTDEWTPNKKVNFDIEYRDGDVVASTETFSVDVEADITHD